VTFPLRTETEKEGEGAGRPEPYPLSRQRRTKKEKEEELTSLITSAFAREGGEKEPPCPPLFFSIDVEERTPPRKEKRGRKQSPFYLPFLLPTARSSKKKRGGGSFLLSFLNGLTKKEGGYTKKKQLTPSSPTSKTSWRMSKKKALFPPLYGGGMERHVHLLSSHFRREKRGGKRPQSPP